jgi:uncharacterized protein (TIGR03437 family)
LAVIKRVIQVATLALLGIGAISAQIATVKVGTTVEGPYFYVDGRQFNTTQIFLWPLGSKHTVQFLMSLNPDDGTSLGYQLGRNATIRYDFSGWRTNGPAIGAGSATEQTVTAITGLTEFIGQVSVQHKLRVQMYSTAAGNGSCTPTAPDQDGDRHGIVYVDGTCIGATTEYFIAAGPHTLAAYPFPGYVFAGWYLNGTPRDPFVSVFTLDSSIQIIPQFMPGKRVRFTSNPTGLKIVVDGTVIQLPPGQPRDQLPAQNYDAYCAPNYAKLPVGSPVGIPPLCIGDFDFLPGSRHQVGGPQSQTDDAGLWWVFSGYTNGLKQNGVYIPDERVATPDLLTANFVPGVPATILTQPAGLKLEVDGRTNWPGYIFMWGAGEKHTVVAPATQVDGRGRRYRFVGWANNGDAKQDVTVPNDRNGITMMARYQVLGQVKVTTEPVGQSVNIDGVPCLTPCTLDRDAGEAVQVSAANTIPGSAYTRLDFAEWLDGETAPAREVTFDTEVQSLRVNYRTSHKLIATSDPVGQVTFNYTPTSPDGFFPEGTQITVTVAPKGGFKFRRWDGDLAGTFSTGYVKMGSPREIIARLDKVPFIASAGIKNAAGITPENTVAPGSIAAIYGENLAEGLEVGPTNPLAQTLANITVMVNDRLLPLLFVSPKQINVQVPSDLTDGDYTLKVKSPKQADVTGTFAVRRNSPGIFTQPNEQNVPYALALHENGTLVTTQSPARRNEIISILGTGFGPYERRVIDGFLVPNDTQYRLSDAVTVLAGEQQFTPQWTGAAPGMIGTAVMKLKVAEEMPQASTLEVIVQINGAQSNKVLLPVE